MGAEQSENFRVRESPDLYALSQKVVKERFWAWPQLVDISGNKNWLKWAQATALPEAETELVVFAGLPGLGKTTLLHQYSDLQEYLFQLSGRRLEMEKVLFDKSLSSVIHTYNLDSPDNLQPEHWKEVSGALTQKIAESVEKGGKFPWSPRRITLGELVGFSRNDAGRSTLQAISGWIQSEPAKAKKIEIFALLPYYKNVLENVDIRQVAREFSPEEFSTYLDEHLGLSHFGVSSDALQKALKMSASPRDAKKVHTYFFVDVVKWFREQRRFLGRELEDCLKKVYVPEQLENEAEPSARTHYQVMALFVQNRLQDEWGFPPESIHVVFNQQRREEVSSRL